MSFATVRSQETWFVPVCTLVLWLLVFTIGTIGVVVPYARPAPPVKKEVPVMAETLQIELTSEPLPSPALDLPRMTEPPPLEVPVAVSVDVPSLTPVAEPSVVAFAIPVEGPVQIVEPKRAVYATPAIVQEPAPPAPVLPPPQQLVYGRGEGRQPAPEYPYRARREGQEGTVKVRFAVGENGQVLTSEAAAPSPWPMLDQAALRVVRERWRFRPGAPRFYEVSIRFQLTR